MIAIHFLIIWVFPIVNRFVSCNNVVSAADLKDIVPRLSTGKRIYNLFFVVELQLGKVPLSNQTSQTNQKSVCDTSLTGFFWTWFSFDKMNTSV